MTPLTYNIRDMQPQDELEIFAQWFAREKPLMLVPAGGLMFVNNACGVCLFRHENLQVEMFLINPDGDIPDHIHPNVDSIEVAMWGMRFTHSGQIILDFEDMEAATGFGIRVRPGDWHGGKACPSGACFLSIQRWINEVPPSTVVNDWSGEVLGDKHLQQITSGAAVPQPTTPKATT